MSADELTPIPAHVLARMRHRFEHRHFPYLPAGEWMKRGQYQQVLMGDYRNGPPAAPLYRLLFLSQSSLCLFYQAGSLRHAAHIESDEVLLRALAEANFPLPT